MRAKRRWNRINAQILVWAGDQRGQLKYDGSPFLLPAWNETAKKGPLQPFRFEGAKDGKDRLVPGTILVTDIINRTPEGGIIKTFDVGDFCDFLERDRGYLFDRGLNIVTDVGDVGAAMAEARPAWENSQVSRAQQILTSEMDRIQRYEAKGQPAPEGSNAQNVGWAISLLQTRAPDQARFGKEDLAKVLSGQYVSLEPEKPATAAVLSAKEIMAEAKSLGLKLNKSELEALVEDDEEQIAFIHEKIAGRREAQAATA